MAKARIMETVIKIAGEISPTLGKTIDSVNKQLGGINDVAIAAGAAVAAIGKAAVDSTKYLTKLGTEYGKAVNDVAAKTGLAGENLEAMKESVKDIYGSNFGESMGDVAEGVSLVYQNTKLIGDELTEVTKAGYALSDTFGYDLSETSRAAKALMSNFGISGEKAMGMIAAGAQNGLDFSGELIDSINEYSVQFAKVGFSADDMFQIFQAGADNGAWNLDKVGDAIKEFSIRSIDGSKGTRNAFKDLGLNADKMMATFANGGEGAEKAFQIVLEKLVGMKNEVERDATGVALFGTMWEDLGVDAVKAMSKAKKGAYDTKNALESINKVKYNDLDSAMEGIKRKCEVALTPAAESVTKAFLEQVPKLEGVIEQITPVIANFAEKIGPAISKGFDALEKGISWLIENKEIVIPVIAGIGAAFATWKIGNFVKGLGGMAGMLSKVTGAFSLLSSPIFWVAVAIGAVVAAGVWLWRNWDTVKQKASELGAWLSKTWQGLKDKTVQVWQNVAASISQKWGEIKQKCSDSINGVKTYLSNGWTNIKNATVNKWTEVKNGISNKWTEIKTSISNFISDIKNKIASGFAEAKEKMLAPFREVAQKIDEVKGKISGAVDKVKNFSFSDIKWPKLAAGGFTNGVSIAGEAGTEAVISFDPRYRADNLEYWAKAGRMLGADMSDFVLGGGSSTVSNYTDLGGVTFSPNITIQGDAKKQDILDAIREAYPEFLDMLEELLDDRGAAVYA